MKVSQDDLGKKGNTVIMKLLELCLQDDEKLEPSLVPLKEWFLLKRQLEHTKKSL